MRAEIRKQSLVCSTPTRVMAYIFCCSVVPRNDHKPVAGTGLGVTNNFQWVGEFMNRESSNTESMSNQNWLYTNLALNPTFI